jgi:predicted RNase H-related nuclease YkuK (DUF458 family)
MIDKLKFKKFGGEFIDDLGEYLRDYLKQYPDVKIYVGSDSEPRTREYTPYAVAVCMYSEERKDGVHYIFARFFGDKAPDIFTRMWKEVELAEAVADYLEEELEGCIERMSPEELVKLGYNSNQDKLVNIDLDVNSNPGFTEKQLELIREGFEFGSTGANKSYSVHDAAYAYLVGRGYRTRTKPHAWAASCAADYHIGKKFRRKKRASERRKFRKNRTRK